MCICFAMWFTMWFAMFPCCAVAWIILLGWWDHSSHLTTFRVEQVGQGGEQSCWLPRSIHKKTSISGQLGMRLFGANSQMDFFHSLAQVLLLNNFWLSSLVCFPLPISPHLLLLHRPNLKAHRWSHQNARPASLSPALLPVVVANLRRPWRLKEENEGKTAASSIKISLYLKMSHFGWRFLKIYA